VFNQTQLGSPTVVTGNIRYTEIQGGGHGGWTNLYGQLALYNWMFAQSVTVPEPGTFVLIAIAAAAGCGARRRRD
jgi:hypothetical protein